MSSVLRLLVIVSFLFLAGNSSVSAAQSLTMAELNNHYLTFRQWQEESSIQQDFLIVTEKHNEKVHVRIAFLVPSINLSVVKQVLSTPQDWCLLLFLHLNVKGCVAGRSSDLSAWVRLYLGRKYYQPLHKAYQLQMDFSGGFSEEGMYWVKLFAKNGPYRTSDYTLELSGIAVEEGTYFEFHASQKSSFMAKVAQSVYFSTLARDKVGFTIINYDDSGIPRYIGDEQGMLERNLVRYLLALRVYLNTSDLQGLNAMERRANDWFDATEQYPQQLREVTKEKYLLAKQKEYQQQLELQQRF